MTDVIFSLYHIHVLQHPFLELRAIVMAEKLVNFEAAPTEPAHYIRTWSRCAGVLTSDMLHQMCHNWCIPHTK